MPPISLVEKGLTEFREEGAEAASPAMRRKAFRRQSMRVASNVREQLFVESAIPSVQLRVDLRELFQSFLAFAAAQFALLVLVNVVNQSSQLLLSSSRHVRSAATGTPALIMISSGSAGRRRDAVHVWVTLRSRTVQIGLTAAIRQHQSTLRLRELDVVTISIANSYVSGRLNRRSRLVISAPCHSVVLSERLSASWSA